MVSMGKESRRGAVSRSHKDRLCGMSLQSPQGGDNDYKLNYVQSNKYL